MANVIRIKRRASGAAGAPVALKSAELAHNEVDDTLYVGKGDDGGGNATSVIALAGKGAFVDRSSAQTVGGKKTFSSAPASNENAAGETDLIRKSQFDAGLATKAAASHGHPIAEITSLQAALDAKASLASPALTGVPTAPTAAGGTSSTQIATTAFVAAAVSALINAAPGALDTLAELPRLWATTRTSRRPSPTALPVSSLSPPTFPISQIQGPRVAASAWSRWRHRMPTTSRSPAGASMASSSMAVRSDGTPECEGIRFGCPKRCGQSIR
jgi:hypothetical protein